MAVDDDEAGDAAAQQAANQAAKRIKAAAKGGAAPGGGNGAVAAAGEGEDEDDMAKYNLDAYDDEVSGSTGASLPFARAVELARPACGTDPRAPPLAAMGAFSNIKGLTYYGNNDEDPYITLESVRRPFLPRRSHPSFLVRSR